MRNTEKEAAKRFMDEQDYSKPAREHLEYPETTMSQMVEQTAKKYPKVTAYEFYGRRTTYAGLVSSVEDAARALMALGIRRNDAVTVCLPNIPQALAIFYGINRIGSVANMIHPLSAQQEISYYLNYADSRVIVTVDMFYEKVKDACAAVSKPVQIIICRMQDVLPVHLKVGFTLKEGHRYLRFPDRKGDLTWKAFMKKGAARREELPPYRFDRKHTATILYSGGTTGKPKGVCLSDLNFNALALQAKEAIRSEIRPGMTMLSCMPMFHGFGLGINIHTILVHGGCCILMPTFSIKNYSDMMIRKRPNYLAGVPNIYGALLAAPALKTADLSFLKGMFCGGDALSLGLKEKVDQFLKDHGASIQVREGYGLTECVTASCLTPRDTFRPHSIGLPFPDTVYDIVRPGTDESLPRGESGEIVLKGPTLMLGYLHEKEETKQTLRRRRDGDIWLYSGDLGYMDEDGYVYFIQRIKRMIVTNGYNVYPSQIEDILDAWDKVSCSCVIGVPDVKRGQLIKAFIVPASGKLPADVTEEEEIKEEIRAYLKERVAAYALPREIELRAELPRTLVGKVAYRILEEECA